MRTKNKILSRKDIAVLEQALLTKGRIVTFVDLQTAFTSAYSYQEIKNKVSALAHAGWLVRLKQGLYAVITDFSTLGVVDLHPFVISQALNEHSYVSFEAALQYYGMFDQMLARIDAVTTATARRYVVKETTYQFFTIKHELYFGFTQQWLGSTYATVADKEKALLDMLYFRSTGYTVSVVLEKLRDYAYEIDCDKLQQYAKCYSMGMVRKVGFLLDQLDVDTTESLRYAQEKRNSYNKLTASSHDFNAKWRLYYDASLIAEANIADYQ